MAQLLNTTPSDEVIERQNSEKSLKQPVAEELVLTAPRMPN
jgi:hypothetical protein